MSIKTVVELDLVGYSDIARVVEDNIGAEGVARLHAQIQAFIDAGLKIIGAERAQVLLKTTGDGAIVAFDASEHAHRFAVGVHRATEEHNATHGQAQRWFRIGIATGEVYQNPNGGWEDAAGTVIAEAVRLETAARPGEIIVDETTFASLPAALEACYGPEQLIAGKRKERFAARRYRVVRRRSNWPRRRRLLIATSSIAIAVGIVVAIPSDVSVRIFHPPYELRNRPLADDFSNGLNYWIFPNGVWQLQTVPASSPIPAHHAVLVRSSRIGVLRAITPAATLYDFESDMRARFVLGDRICWAFRVQDNRKHAYVFEITRQPNRIELSGYVYPGRKLIPGSVTGQVIRGCCTSDDALTIHSIVQGNRFSIAVKLEATFANYDSDSDAAHWFELPTVQVERPRYRYGNIGLLETDPSAAMLVEYVQVRKITHYALPAAS